MIVATGGFSWGQGSKVTGDTAYKDTSGLTEKVQRSSPLTPYQEGYIDTKYAYRDSAGRCLLLHNSLPKGGLKYTDPNGKQYVYAVFWTRIINETPDPFEFTINFPSDSFELPSSSGNYFKLLIPSVLMTPDKEPKRDYGLTGLKNFLDDSLHKPSSLKRTVPPKEAICFYVITLFDRGLDGTLRTGLHLKEQNLFYRVNEKEILCGKVGLKKWMLQE
jgi:hypothetical protein